MEPSSMDWARAPLSELCAYIVDRYHVPIRVDLVRIEGLLRAAQEEMPDKEEYLSTLRRGWKALAAALRAHLEKEEAALFPMVARLEREGGAEDALVEALLGGLGREHDDAALALLSLARHTHGFRPPEGSGPAFRALLERLERFDAELREHVALENDFLVPRALRLARSLG